MARPIQAATCCLEIVSALLPMAQIKPSSSPCYCCDNLPLVLAGRAQLHISLVQPVLRLPRNLLVLFRDALLSSSQSVPNTGWATIAPCGFDNDASQVCVAGLRDASAPVRFPLESSLGTTPQ